MRVAVASGKGGTGKTTVAVSLALSLADDPRWVDVHSMNCTDQYKTAPLFAVPSPSRSVALHAQKERVDDARCR